MRLEYPTQTDLSGGLNTQSALFTEANEALVARNVDVTTDGVLKRQGTVRLLTESAGQTVASHFFVSNSGVPLAVVATDTAVRIYSVNNGNLVLLRSVANVFSAAPKDVRFLTVPGAMLRVLVLCRNQQPLQITLFDFKATNQISGAARFYDYFRFVAVDTANKIAATYAFVNNVNVSPALTANVDYYALNTGLIVNAFNTASLILFAVSVWAEADAWRAENFHTVVPRYHDNAAALSIEIPATILEDTLSEERVAPYRYIRANAAPIGVGQQTFTTLINYTAINGGAVPFPANQTITYSRYAFTNGSFADAEKRYPDLTTISEYQLGNRFITFGAVKQYLKYTLNSTTSVSEGRCIVPNHDFQNGDVVVTTVRRNNGFALTSSDTTTLKYVKKLDANRFEIYFDALLTNRDSSSYARQNVWGCQGVTAASAAGQLFTFPFNIPSGTALTHYNTTNSNVGIPSGTYYIFYWAASGASHTYYVFYDAAMQFPVTSATLTGQGGIWAVLQDWEIERRTQDNLYIARARKVTFNNGLGAAPVNMRVLRLNSVGTPDEFVLTPLANGNLTGPWSVAFSAEEILWSTALASTSTVIARTFYINGHLSSNPEHWQILVNVEHKWCGTAFASKVAFSANPSTAAWSDLDLTTVPVGGYGGVANFNTGVFPNVAAVYGNRLVFSVNSRLVFSAILGSGVNAYPYPYMSVHPGIDTTEPVNPFDLVINDADNAAVTALHVWQDKLFAFTSDRAYQVTATSATQRDVALLSGNGATNPYCVCNSDRVLYFASRNGVYAVPLLDSGQYRTNEVSVKVSSDISAAIRSAARPVLVYNNDDATVTLCAGNDIYRYNVRYDAWTTYDSVIPFNVQYAAVMQKWLVMTCSNVLGTSLVREGGASYVDYATSVTPTNSTVLVPFLRSLTKPLQVFYSTPWRMSSVLTYEDISVYINSTKLVFGQQFRKVNATTIEVFLNITGTLPITFVYNDANTWNGAVTLFNNWPQGINYGAFNPTSLATQTYTVNLSTTPRGVSLAAAGAPLGGPIIPTLTNGYVYIAEYVTSANAAELLDMYKRLESVSVLLSADTRQSRTESVTPQYLLGEPDNFNAGVRVAVSAVAGRESIGDNYVTLNSETYADDYVLYRDRVNLLGFMFNVIVMSNVAYPFKLVAWGVDVDIRSGTGQVSSTRN